MPPGLPEQRVQGLPCPLRPAKGHILLRINQRMMMSGRNKKRLTRVQPCNLKLKRAMQSLMCAQLYISDVDRRTKVQQQLVERYKKQLDGSELERGKLAE
ncbi:hypothetical protein RHMOL_Rhmol01G0215800 [Rhododendron molle]|uniref:Uncharacterized protein n=1 Tax=Rhododendron molle TaxID=49168 RepID=A0ACC0Q5V3_RHOML|nr:hypothetical protein RHMOL_Rhmol01G0215800 [Rhododendron molle]